MTKHIIREGLALVTKAGAHVCVGDEVTDFRGEKAVVRDATAPKSPASTGRVYVTVPGVTSQQGYFPSVYGLMWVNGPRAKRAK